MKRLKSIDLDMNLKRSCDVRPLIRGLLTSLVPGWFPCSDRIHEFRAANLEVWCPLCAKMHIHTWNPANDGRYAEPRGCHRWADSPVGSYWVSVWRKRDAIHVLHYVPPGTAIIRPIQRKVIIPGDAVDGIIPDTDLPSTDGSHKG